MCIRDNDNVCHCAVTLYFVIVLSYRSAWRMKNEECLKNWQWQAGIWQRLSLCCHIVVCHCAIIQECMENEEWRVHEELTMSGWNMTTSVIVLSYVNISLSHLVSNLHYASVIVSVSSCTFSQVGGRLTLYSLCAECPANFTRISSVNGCYNVVTRNLDWTNAGLECRRLHRRAHLLIINDEQEQTAVAGMLNSTDG